MCGSRTDCRRFIRCRELPAHQDDDDDGQLRHQIGGRQLERHRCGEVRAFAKNRSRQRDGCVRARRRCRAKSGRSSLLISPFEITAWTTPESPNPRISGHKISQNIANAIQRAWPKAAMKFAMIRLCSRRSRPGFCTNRDLQSW